MYKRQADYRLIQRDQHSNLRVVCRCKAHEGKNVAVLYSVFVEVIQLLGGAGLTANAVARDRCISTGGIAAAGYDLFSQIADLLRGCLLYTSISTRPFC